MTGPPPEAPAASETDDRGVDDFARLVEAYATDSQPSRADVLRGASDLNNAIAASVHLDAGERRTLLERLGRAERSKLKAFPPPKLIGAKRKLAPNGDSYVVELEFER